MAAHRMPHDADVRAIQFWERRVERLWEFGRDVAVHFVVGGPGGLGCVQVEAGAGAEVPEVVFALDFEPSYIIERSY